MTVREAMMSPAVTVSHNSSALSALKLLVEKGISGAPVVSEDLRLVGVVTEFDLLLAIDHVGEHVPISAIMTPDPVSVDIDSPLEEARDMLLTHNWRRLPVLDGGKVAGVLSRRDILRVRFGL